MTDEIKAAEARGYSKGYAAGKRRIESEDEIEARMEKYRQERDRCRWEAFFCAAITGTIQNGGWKTGETTWRTSDDYARGCAYIADKMLEEAKRRYD